MADGENVGVLTKGEALAKAREMELDLVLVSENANPPVARILDFSKFLYDENKKAQAIKAKSKKSDVKEFIFGPSIGLKDIETRISRAREFLGDGHKVKVSIKLKGREAAFPQIGEEKLKKFREGLADIARAEGDLRRAGRLITMTLVKTK